MEASPVPRLKLKPLEPPASSVGGGSFPGIRFDAYAAENGGLTPKITSAPGIYYTEQGRNHPSRLPGYSGFVPGLTTDFTGKTYGFITRAHDSEARLRTSGVQTDRSSWDALGRGSATLSELTEERRIYEHKMGMRGTANGMRNLNLLRLVATTPRRKFRTQEEVEAPMLERMSQRTSRGLSRGGAQTARDGPVGPQPYGVRPDRDQHEWRVAQEYIRHELHVPPTVWDPSMDRIYTRADPAKGWSASGMYEMPRGWMGFGLRVPPEFAEDERFWTSYHTTFYACPAEWLPTILTNGQCVIPGDVLIDGSKTKIVYVVQKDLIEKTDPNTDRKDRNCTRLYTSPSPTYAAMKLDKMTRGKGFAAYQGRKLYFILECKQLGGSLAMGGFYKCGETIGWEYNAPRGSRISPHFLNTEIEYYTLRKSSVIPYRLLVKTDDLRLVETRTQSGTFRQEPEKTWRETTWKRADHPPYGSMSFPGLGFPFKDFVGPDAEDPAQSDRRTKRT